MGKKKVIISACLLGEYCRYDGKTKAINEVIEAFKEYEIIPFCPEAPLFGTPRERISVVKIDKKNRIITDDTHKDVTKLLEDEINSFILKNPNPDAIVLKSKSPSCGVGTTPILDKNRTILKYENGIAAEIFLQKYKKIEILDEHDFKN
jgi:uncharacterized protein YbbK (DUF523 family)